MRIDRALLCVALSLAAPRAMAAPLEPEACATLRTEHQSLVAGGAKSDMARGADWAKANLAPDRLAKIERLITVEEQLSFRCGELLTARPLIKERPKTEGDRPDASAAGLDASGDDPATGPSASGGPARGTPSNIPPPKRKDAAKAAKNQATSQ